MEHDEHGELELTLDDDNLGRIVEKLIANCIRLRTLHHLGKRFVVVDVKWVTL